MLLTSLSHSNDRADAVVVGSDRLTKDQLLEQALGLAASIPGTGSVAVHATASVETIRAVVACLLAGRTVVPVPPDSGPAERRHILADSGAKVWVGPTVSDVELPTVDPAVGPTRSPAGWPVPAPDSTAITLYTSGTTGPPKGVEMTHDSLAAGLDALADAWDWTEEDVVVHGLPLFHSHGLILGVLGSLRVGSGFRHTVKPRADAYAATSGSMYFGVPTVWGRIAKDLSACASLSSARLLVSGSAPLSVPVFEALCSNIGLAPIERYGMTEALVPLSTRADGEKRPGWVGTAVAGAQVRVMDEFGGIVPSDSETIGALQVRGPMLFKRYLGQPDATAAAWTDDGWFRTGDVAVCDETGFHRIVGRESTDLVKSGGYRIGTGEVEAALHEHPSVKEAAVAGLPDEDLGQRLVAFVVTADKSRSSKEALIEHVATTLSWHKRPREVVFVDELPRNAMGKVLKSQLW